MRHGMDNFGDLGANVCWHLGVSAKVVVHLLNAVIAEFLQTVRKNITASYFDIGANNPARRCPRHDSLFFCGRPQGRFSQIGSLGDYVEILPLARSQTLRH